MKQHQETHYTAGIDYRLGSPHLQHRQLFDRLSALICDGLATATQGAISPAVLEVGAGHGGISELILARGYYLTVTEMSGASAEILERSYGMNDRLQVVHDPNGSLEVLGEAKFGAVLCCSVLHHIPDYLAFVADALPRTLLHGGTFISIQDPLQYDRMPPFTHRLDRAAYLTWRIGQGNLLVGVASLTRRLRGAYDDSKAGDMVEYHVVRNGVDAEALESYLLGCFESVKLERYWSNQSRLAQRVGDRLGLRNTFAIRAEGYLGP